MPRANRSIKDGYPITAPFTSRQEIDAYLGSDRVQCLLCGHSFKLLETHLRSVHGMTGDEYREAYSIPYGRGLCGITLSVRREELGRALWKEHESRQLSALEAARAVQSANGNPQRGKPECWKAERSGIANMNSKLTDDQVSEIRKRRKQGETVTALGGEYGVSASNISQICLNQTWKRAS